MYTQLYICIYIHMYTYIHVHILSCAHIYMYTQLYIYIYIYIRTRIYMYTYSYVHTSTCMGWLRLVGSLQLLVSFVEYCLFYRALLQKRHMILRSLLIVATPYDIRTHVILHTRSHVCVYKCSPTIIKITCVRKSHGVATIGRLLKIICLFCKEPYKRDNILRTRRDSTMRGYHV